MHKYVLSRNLSVIAFFYLLCLTSPALAQNWEWATGSSCKMGYFESAPIAVDNKGNVYEAGQYSYHISDTFVSVFGPYTVVDSAATGNQAILVSTDASGAYRWAIGVQYGKVSFTSVKADPFGNVYMIGKSDHYFRFGDKSLSDSTYIIAKVDSGGSVVWVKPLNPRPFELNPLRISSSGNLYIAGTFRGKTFMVGSTVLTNIDTSGVTWDVFIAKFDSSGNPIWAKSFGGNSADNVADMEVTKDSVICIGGTTGSTSMQMDGSTVLTAPAGQKLYVAQFNGNGVPLWGKVMRAWSSTNFGVNGITTDENNNVYVTGQYGNQFIFGNDTLPVPYAAGKFGYMFLTKYNASGQEKWAQTIPGTNVFYTGYSVVSDGCLVWVSGGNNGSPWDNDTMFLVSYDTSGYLVNKIELGCGGDDVNAIATDHKGNLYVGGDYYCDQFVVGNDTLTRTDNVQEALFLLKYNYGYAICKTSAVEPVNTPVAAYNLFPNPAAGECTIHCNIPFGQGARMDLYDITGRLMGQYPLHGSDCIISLTNLVPGLYECRISNSGNAVQTLKLVVGR